MQFTYHENCGHETLNISDDIYRYIIKARRHKVDDEIYFRNLNDDFIYKYTLRNIGKKDAFLTFLSKEEKIIKADNQLHLAWSVIDPKTVEKYISSLNEIGVDKITFVYSSYSQKNFKPNFEKLKKILINSSQQCGRSTLMKLETCESLELFLLDYPQTKILDFSDNKLENTANIDTILIGTEGGFSQEERVLFNKDNILGLNSNLILRSETAAISVASKILL
ncbi:MAG: 16S rRNA (uracil(1498)-N(3))-methyltransferase [Campylobacteraceae bacterium]|nr:16S rRNA (uracil(1498)-N(3))-methyltransferase [Campylobacteraceae bacterium]